MRIIAYTTIFAIAVMTASAAPLRAETKEFKADLTAAMEVPPNTSKAAGSANMNYDTITKKLTYTITAAGLTGPATGAHFHGPADAGKNAAIVLPIPVSAAEMTGTATLTIAQEADLLAGKWYVNVHTDVNKSGEIRGQVVPSK